MQGADTGPRILSIVNNGKKPDVRGAQKDEWLADTGATIALTNDLGALHEPTYDDKPC
jgi:hypothetical protein